MAFIEIETIDRNTFDTMWMGCAAINFFIDNETKMPCDLNSQDQVLMTGNY